MTIKMTIKITTKASIIFLILLVWAAACVPMASSQVEDDQSPTKPAIAETKMFNKDEGLSIEKLQNMILMAPNTGIAVQLSDGLYSEAGMTVLLLPEITLGDLNGDQIEDAAILLSENDGGTGNFVFLVVITSHDGQFNQIGNFFIDDRPLIHSLRMENGEILLEATIHAINDVMVSPTLRITQTYKMLDQNVMLVNQSSTANGGTERNITIDSPLEGSEVAGIVQIKGSMPVAPFENNLSLKIFDLDGTELYTNGFMVNSEDVGSPAVFDNQVSLPNLSSGSWVRLELSELSMADGSILALDSVIVKIE